MPLKRRIPRTENLRERDAWRRTADEDTTGKMDIRPAADEDNIVVFDSLGNSKDGGVPLSSIAGGIRRAYFYGRTR